jgi:hypothetical protein
MAKDSKVYLKAAREVLRRGWTRGKWYGINPNHSGTDYQNGSVCMLGALDAARFKRDKDGLVNGKQMSFLGSGVLEGHEDLISVAKEKFPARAVSTSSFWGVNDHMSGGSHEVVILLIEAAIRAYKNGR